MKIKIKTEHRALIAVVLSAAFFIAWYAVFNPSKPAVAPQASTQAATAENALSEVTAKDGAAAEPAKPKAEATAAADDPQSKIPASSVEIKNNLVAAAVSSDGGVLTGWSLADYTQGTEKGSPLMDLASVDVGGHRFLGLSLEGTGFTIPANPRYEVVSSTDSEVVLRWRRPGEITIVKKISLAPDRYVADVSIDVTNESAKPVSVKTGLSLSGINLPQEKKGFLSFMQPPQTDIVQPVYYSDAKVHRESKVAETVSVPGAVYWSGLESRYFISAVIPRVQGEGLAAFYGAEKVEGGKPGTMELWAGTSLPSAAITPGQSSSFAFTVYSGPKDIKQLKEMGVGLEKAIDYGWFSVIAVPILYLLKFFYSLINNYGVAIILLTVFVKLLLHPINVKSLKSMKAMQQLQPRLKELQTKFKGDKQRLNAETMQLFKAHKVNPMGGCLPMVLQLPIYIALYKVLWSSIELYHAPFFWFYRDLSAPDPYLITPILLGIFMVAQQHLTPSASVDPAQKKMMMFMPIMFTMFMLFLPVGLVIYILVNTVTSVTQQWMYNKGIGFMDLVRGRFKLRAAKA